MKRLLDIFVALSLLVVFFVPMVFIAILIKLTSPGPILYWSKRTGVNGNIINMPKFRSMSSNTPLVPSHLLVDPNKYISRLGRLLRRASLDELPQIYSIIKGDMSVVGPRPALIGEEELILLRKRYNIDYLIPGLTGWAQVNGRDELTVEEKVCLEVEYSKKKSISFDCWIIWLTFLTVIKSRGISH